MKKRDIRILTACVLGLLAIFLWMQFGGEGYRNEHTGNVGTPLRQLGRNHFPED